MSYREGGIREAEKSDIGEILRVQNQHLYENKPPRELEDGFLVGEKDREILRNYVNKESRDALVYENGDIRGYALSSPGFSGVFAPEYVLETFKDKCNIEEPEKEARSFVHLAVGEEHQGTGIADELFNDMERLYPEKKLLGETNVLNQTMQKFLRRHDWEPLEQKYTWEDQPEIEWNIWHQ